jgi:hypothetical protein
MVERKYGILRLIGTLLIIWGVINILIGVVAGIILLTGNFYPGYSEGLNNVGWLPVVIGLGNGIPAVVLGSVLRLLTDVEYNTRAAIASVDSARKASEAAVKNSDMLLKNTETVMRNTEVAVKNTESALKAAPTTLLGGAVSTAQQAANTAVSAANEATQAAANVVDDAADAARNAVSGATQVLPKLGS